MNGQPSNTTTVYRFQQSPTSPDIVAITTHEAEALNPTTTSASHSVVSDPLASGGKKLQINSDAHGHTTLTFDLETNTEPGEWILQPTIAAPQGSTITFAINARQAGTPDGHDPITLDPQCSAQTFTGAGLTNPKGISIPYSVCDPELPLTPDSSRPQTLTLSAISSSTYTIDQLRIIWRKKWQTASAVLG